MAALTNESKIPVGALLVGKYRVTREIGRGGMAAVYEAEHMALGKKIAVKVLAAELAASTVVIERFFREARAAASVRSPHIVDVYDSGRLEDGRPFIAMEMLEGESLYERMARIRIIQVRSTVQIIRHCCKGLTKAHAAGIIHRDLKPENIFLVTGEEGEEIAKILDFGLAKFYAPLATDEKASRLTREGAVFGTPAYMSPEQVKGQGSVDHRADLWALGCMTYECLIGRPVWNTDQGVAMTFAAIATGIMPVPSQMRPGLPPAFDEWFRRALDRDPDRRFQTANELGDALLRAFNQQPLTSSSDSEMKAIAQLAELLPDESVRLDTNPLLLQDAPTSQRNMLVGSYSQNRLPELSTSQQMSAPVVIAPRRPSPVRYAISGAFMLVGTVAAFTVWHRALGPQILEPTIASTAAGATPPPEPGDAGGVTSGSEGDPRWAAALEEGQRFFATGDVDTALRKFKEAQDQGATSARWFSDEVKLGAAGELKGPCRPIAFSQPRLGVPGAAERPSIASSARGAVVAWTDEHEQAGHDHVYSTVIDQFGRPQSRPRDLTPEGTAVERPSVLSAGDRTILLYLDKGGREAGVDDELAQRRAQGAPSRVADPRGRPGLDAPAHRREPEAQIGVLTGPGALVKAPGGDQRGAEHGRVGRLGVGTLEAAERLALAHLGAGHDVASDERGVIGSRDVDDGAGEHRRVARRGRREVGIEQVRVRVGVGVDEHQPFPFGRGGPPVAGEPGGGDRAGRMQAHPRRQLARARLGPRAVVGDDQLVTGGERQARQSVDQGVELALGPQEGHDHRHPRASSHSRSAGSRLSREAGRSRSRSRCRPRRIRRWPQRDRRPRPRRRWTHRAGPWPPRTRRSCA